jgi:sec-independent protein translocase protein TatA
MNPLFLAWSPGVPELILILLVVMLLFGAKRLPDLARSLGRSLSEFKKGKDEGTRDSESRAPQDGKQNGDTKA